MACALSRFVTCTRFWSGHRREAGVFGDGRPAAKAAARHASAAGRAPDVAERQAVLRRRLEFLEEPASFFHDNERPLRAEEVADPYRRGMLLTARATSRAERTWLRETLGEEPPRIRHRMHRQRSACARRSRELTVHGGTPMLAIDRHS
jgi:hypothetical protein